MRPLREAPGREGRAWHSHNLRPVQDPERGAVTSNLHWQDFLRIAAALKPTRFNIGALLRDVDNAALYPVGDALVLPFRHEAHHRYFMEELEAPLARRTLEVIVSQAFGQPMTLKPLWCPRPL